MSCFICFSCLSLVGTEPQTASSMAVSLYFDALKLNPKQHHPWLFYGIFMLEAASSMAILWYFHAQSSIIHGYCMVFSCSKQQHPWLFYGIFML